VLNASQLQIPEYLLDVAPPLSRAGEPCELPHGVKPVRDSLPARPLLTPEAINGSAYALPGAHPFLLGCSCSWCFITSKLSPADLFPDSLWIDEYQEKL